MIAGVRDPDVAGLVDFDRLGAFQTSLPRVETTERETIGAVRRETGDAIVPAVFRHVHRSVVRKRDVGGQPELSGFVAVFAEGPDQCAVRFVNQQT